MRLGEYVCVNKKFLKVFGLVLLTVVCSGCWTLTGIKWGTKFHHVDGALQQTLTAPDGKTYELRYDQQWYTYGMGDGSDYGHIHRLVYSLYVSGGLLKQWQFAEDIRGQLFLEGQDELVIVFENDRKTEIYAHEMSANKFRKHEVKASLTGSQFPVISEYAARRIALDFLSRSEWSFSCRDWKMLRAAQEIYGPGLMQGLNSIRNGENVLRFCFKNCPPTGFKELAGTVYDLIHDNKLKGHTESVFYDNPFEGQGYRNISCDR